MDPLSQATIGAVAAQSVIKKVDLARIGLIGALAGMAPEGVVEGVRVWRPWLAHDKSEIFAFARRCAAALAAARVGTIL